MVFSGVEGTGGGVLLGVVFFIVSDVFIVVVVVNVGWVASGGVPETGRWGTGGGVGVGGGTRDGWCTRSGSLEAGWFW